MSLETVVRESVHFLDALLTDETGKPTFYLIDNTTLSISLSEEAMLAVNSAKLNAIYNLLSEEEKDNGGYSEEYLTGNYGNQDFFSLLDELNAYANGLNSSIKLPRPKNGNSHSALAGPLAMIVFVLRYYQYHEQVGPTYFKNVLMNGSLRTVVHILINQALDEVKAGRQLPDLQVDVEFWEKTLQVKEQLRMLKLIIP